MPERNCGKCVYHTDGSCSRWECEMTTIEDVKKNAIREFASECDKRRFGNGLDIGGFNVGGYEIMQTVSGFANYYIERIEKNEK